MTVTERDIQFQTSHPNVPGVDQSDREVPVNLRQSGSTPVQMLISTRVRKSPFWHLSIEAGCWRATVYNRMYHPRGYVRPEDGGAMAEYDALVNRVTLWNVAVERQIRVKGPDAEAFVDYVITRDATKIKPMHGKYAILCNEAGGILNDPVLLRPAEDEFWFSLSDSDLMLWLQGINLGKRWDVDIREIDKMGRHCVDSNELAIDGLPVSDEDRVGEEGRGFEYILHGLNPERVLIASEAVGLGRAALNRAVNYAKEREVFGRAIGKNQAIQHPLAESWIELEAAELLARRAGWKYDQGLPCGPDANAAKFYAAEVGFRACTRAVATHGGMGYAKEYHVERYLREMMIPRIAPISPQLILCHIAEKVLGLPKSY